MVHREDICLSHNDAQECNVLASNADNEVLTLINFEYGGWNPTDFNIANSFNEVIQNTSNFEKGASLLI
jgi:thiamine kinase-like enzyme